MRKEKLPKDIIGFCLVSIGIIIYTIQKILVEFKIINEISVNRICIISLIIIIYGLLNIIFSDLGKMIIKENMLIIKHIPFMIIMSYLMKEIIIGITTSSKSTKEIIAYIISFIIIEIGCAFSFIRKFDEEMEKNI